MDTPPVELALCSNEGTLIDFTPDDRETEHNAQPTTPSFQPLTPPRELVDSLGSPVSHPTRRSEPSSPSPFDPIKEEPRVETPDQDFIRTSAFDPLEPDGNVPREATLPREESTHPPPAHPWNRPTLDPLSRPDHFSRTTAHTTLSELMFNFDLDPTTLTELIHDACQTARQVGVSTHDLLSRSVFLGTTDLGVTPLCLEASRVELGGGLELVWWLIENTDPGEVEGEVRKGCLMRRGGMGEQSVWSVLRGFVPEPRGRKTVGYDVEVEAVVVVPGLDPQTDSDEDMEIIECEFLDQADIETLKSSSDGEHEAHVHRARIVMPSVNEYLGSGGKVLTAEWMYEGRLWAFSMRESTLLLTLRQTSPLVSPDPIHIQALIRLWPLDLPWTEVPELDHIGPDRLLAQTLDGLLPSPLYECELEEQAVVPGEVGVGASSLWKTDIRASMFSLFELVGPRGGIKVEVVLRVREQEREVEVDDADWQWVDD